MFSRTNFANLKIRRLARLSDGEIRSLKISRKTDNFGNEVIFIDNWLRELDFCKKIIGKQGGIEPETVILWTGSSVDKASDIS